MPRYDYNLISIGAGSAGLITSYIAAAIKARVALVERKKMGGDCLNTGCVPSKSLLASAKVAKLMKQHELYGLKNVEYEIDFPRVMERIQEIIAQIAPHDSVERYTELGVDCHLGDARMRTPHEVEVEGKVLSAKNIVIATGAHPFMPPIPGLKAAPVSNSDTIWSLRVQPRRLAVIGGGPIGCELSQAFRRLGSEVTIFDQAPRILPREDSDVVSYVVESFAQDGITLLNGIRILRVEKQDAGTLIHIEQDGVEKAERVDHILVATGRRANSSGFGLEEIGVEINPNGTIKVDPFLRSSVPSIYACGDVAGPYQFTHMSGHQAWYVAVNSLFSPFKKFAVDYSVVPWCTYTDPELARVGLSEEEAKAEGVEHQVTRYEMKELDRAVAERAEQGVVKVITPPGKDRILGATICGIHAGDLLAEFILAMKHGIGLNKILGTIHPYPTFAEANKMTAGVWRRNHAPQRLLRWLEKFHRWRR